MKHVDVVCAVIKNARGEIFCCKRGPGRALEGYFEFPGGKVEPGEAHEETIIREIKEELKSDIIPLRYIGMSNHTYEELEKPFSITLYAYECELVKGSLELSEHTEKKWVSIDTIDKINFAAADIPIIKMIKNE